MMNIGNGREVFPFDQSNPENFFSCLHSLRIHLENVRTGKGLVIRYKGSDELAGRELFFHYERKTLYGMKLHVDGQDWNNPWLLGLGNLTDQHLGISEAYSQEEPVGYEAFQHAVNEVIRKLDRKNKLAKKDKKNKLAKNDEKNKPKEDKNNWKSGLQTYVGTILIMSIEPVRFIWLGNDFYLDLMKPMLPSRSLTTGERKLITSWKSVLS